MAIDIASMTGPQMAAYAAAVGFLPTTTTRSVSLSAAQLATLNSVPVEIIPAPGAGKLIVVYGWILAYTFVTTPYPSYENDAGLFFNGNSLAHTSVLSGTEDRYDIGSLALAGDDNPASVLVNQPAMFSASLDDNTGDGTLVVTYFYAIFDA